MSYKNKYNNRYEGGDYSSYGGSSSSSSRRSGGGDFRCVAPPKAQDVSKKGYTNQTAISQTVAAMPSYEQLCKRAKTEEEYWDDDEDETPAAPKNEADEDSEEDPLDAFMAGIEKEVTKEKVKKELPMAAKEKKQVKGIRDDIEEEDDEESYYRYMKENPLAGVNVEEEELEIEYDDDGNPIAPVKSKWIDPLPPLDHSTITYKPFEKNFYQEHEEIKALAPQEVENLRTTLGIKVLGAACPRLAVSFAHFNLDKELMRAVRKAQYEKPTPIQSQAVPCALSGRDIIGIAKTGSGKTLAFLLPMLIHIMDQEELEQGQGPIGLILAPTRELAMQIYTEAKKFGKVYNINVACCFGGGSKWEQSKALEAGAEIVVSTPGRMIDMIKMKATNLERVTFLVLDEADRMFDMGFEPQVRSICNHVRPDRQCLMFSATFKKRIERLARDVLSDPVKIVQGGLQGEASEDVTQHIMMFYGMDKEPETRKFQWLAENLVGFCSQGTVLIFVTKKADSELVAEQLRQRDHKLGLLHGDVEQTERTKIIAAFKRKDFPILVATDVCARGLDISHIRTVINYDVARDIDTHTHRIGRTGRAGEKGMAYTLVTEKDKEFAGHIVRNLEGANQKVPKELMDLAMQSQWFRKSRFRGGKGKHLTELKAKMRPGLGCSEESAMSHLSEQSPSFTSYQKESVPSNSGPQPVNRLAVMKAAYGAQFRNQFRPASDSAPSQAPPPPPPPSGESDQPRKKKSRWE